MRGYEKLMEENNLSLNDLPYEAKLAIKSISDADSMIALNKAKGKKVSPSAYNKINANDKWAVNEILDYLDKTDTNKPEAPFTEEEIKEDIISDAKPEMQKDADLQKGMDFDAELTAMYKTGKKEYTSAELKSVAPKCEEQIFSTYTADGENGIETSNFLIKETDKLVFTISKI